MKVLLVSIIMKLLCLKMFKKKKRKVLSIWRAPCWMVAASQHLQGKRRRGNKLYLHHHWGAIVLTTKGGRLEKYATE